MVDKIQLMVSWHSSSIEEIFEILKSSPHGLSEMEIEKRLSAFGLNEIKERKENEFLRLLRHFHDPLIYILIAAGLLTIYLGEFADSAIVFAVVVVNATIGYMQERRAEKTLEALKKMVEVKARVVRTVEMDIPAKFLVPGDVVVLEAGMRVPADARLFEAKSLRVDESLLTGESFPAEKISAVVEEKSVTRPNMVFAGTMISEGYGKAVVVATGEQTEIGKIARRTAKETGAETPLIQKIRRLGGRIFLAIILISVLNFFVGFYRGYSFNTTFLASVSLAVAAIPESLPALLTMILARGVRDMALRKAVVRTLPAVETLGSVTVICTDKTGTLTKNKMQVVKLSAGGMEYDAYDVEELRSVDAREVRMMLLAGYICNRAVYREVDGEYIVSGDPTEIALLEVAAKAGIKGGEWSVLDEIPFDPAIRFMATAVEEEGIAMIYAKGAPERILAMCSHMMVNGRALEINTELNGIAEKFASRGMRVLAFAYKPADVEEFSIKEHLRDMIFLGFQCMRDPPREESYEAVKKCKKAGIRVVMVTGDHPATALAIARELGIEGDVVTGEEVEEMSNEELIEKKAGVFARVLPEHKFRIVRALQKGGETVAVTGDGVNDAPALKAAEIGIAMGSGTEVAKEASEIVILDDNFATIVAAIEEGRNVFRKIQKVLAWTLPTNGGEGVAILSAFLVGIALPILPIQILWINTVTAILLGTTLVFEPKESGLLKAKPTKEELLNRQIMLRIAWISLLMVLGTYLLFFTQDNEIAARTVAMNTIVFFEIFYLLSARSLDKPFFALKRKNPAILPGIAAMVALQIIVTQTQLTWLQTTPLSTLMWIKIVVVSSSVLILSELAKLKKL